MVNAFPRAALLPARLFLLARSKSTDGGTEVVETIRTDLQRQIARITPTFDAKMGGAVSARWAMTAAPTTRKRGITVQIATAPRVQVSAVGLRVEIHQRFLALTPHACLERVVVCFKLIPALILVFLMRQSSATQ